MKCIKCGSENIIPKSFKNDAGSVEHYIRCRHCGYSDASEIKPQMVNTKTHARSQDMTP